MNPVVLKLIEKGEDITMEVLRYANKMQDQINELNREELNDHNKKIDNLQKQHDIIVDMAVNKDLSYDEKMNLLQKMDELQKRIDEVIQDKKEFEHQEKEKIETEKKKAGQVMLEIATGVIPFTTAYRAIKNRKDNKRKNIDETEVIENSSTNVIENDAKKQIEQ